MNNNLTHCPIWGTNFNRHSIEGEFHILDSPRAGGKYKIDAASLEALKKASPEQKACLTNWLVKQRKMGVECPEVNFNSESIFWAGQIPSVIERIDMALLYFGERIKKPKDDVMHENYYGLDQFSAATSGLDPLYEDGILPLLGEHEYFNTDKYNRLKTMTAKGWQRYAELKNQQPNSSQAFVAMWFDPSMHEIYDTGISQAIEDAGYDPIRIDRQEHNNKIDDEIIAHIRRSKFVVADFTSEIFERTKNGKVIQTTEPRGGVYFEAGFAKGLGKEVIWTVNEDVLKFVHFDTRQFAHIVWNSAEDLREKLSRRISATLGDGPLKKSKDA
jgi:hypothetical protein